MQDFIGGDRTVDEDVMTALNDKDMGQASLMEAIKARMEGIYK